MNKTEMSQFPKSAGANAAMVANIQQSPQTQTDMETA